MLCEDQNGFRKKLYYRDGYFTLKVLDERHREFNIETTTTFADFKKVFDRVIRRKFSETLASVDVPNR